jgi:hypothetical protein
LLVALLPLAQKKYPGDALAPTALHQPSEVSSAEKLVLLKSAYRESLQAYGCCSIFFFKYYGIAFPILPGIAGGLAN